MPKKRTLDMSDVERLLEEGLRVCERMLNAVERGQLPKALALCPDLRNFRDRLATVASGESLDGHRGALERLLKPRRTDPVIRAELLEKLALSHIVNIVDEAGRRDIDVRLVWRGLLAGVYGDDLVRDQPLDEVLAAIEPFEGQFRARLGALWMHIEKGLEKPAGTPIPPVPVWMIFQRRGSSLMPRKRPAKKKLNTNPSLH